VTPTTTPLFTNVLALECGEFPRNPVCVYLPYSALTIGNVYEIDGVCFEITGLTTCSPATLFAPEFEYYDCSACISGALPYVVESCCGAIGTLTLLVVQSPDPIGQNILFQNAIGQNACFTVLSLGNLNDLYNGVIHTPVNQFTCFADCNDPCCEQYCPVEFVNCCDPSDIRWGIIDTTIWVVGNTIFDGGCYEYTGNIANLSLPQVSTGMFPQLRYDGCEICKYYNNLCPNPGGFDNLLFRECSNPTNVVNISVIASLFTLGDILVLSSQNPPLVGTTSCFEYIGTSTGPATLLTTQGPDYTGCTECQLENNWVTMEFTGCCYGDIIYLTVPPTTQIGDVVSVISLYGNNGPYCYGCSNTTPTNVVPYLFVGLANEGDPIPFGCLSTIACVDLLGNPLNCPDILIYSGNSMLDTLVENTVLFSSTTYTPLANFVSGTNGSVPRSTMNIFNNVLWGVAEIFGPLEEGTVYTYDPNSNVISLIHAFNGDGPLGTGSFPYNEIIQASDGYLYGVAYLGGLNGNTPSFLGGGTLYRIDPITSGFTVVHNFDANTGSGNAGGDRPLCTMTEDSGLLYGSTRYGGTSNMGTIFTWNLSTSAYTVIHNFSGSSFNDGEQPIHVKWVKKNNKLYSTTYFGGTYGDGVLYEVDAVTQVVTTLFSFDSVNTGSNPWKDIFLEGDDLIGVCVNGGTNSKGTLWRFNTITNSLTILIHFTQSNLPIAPIPVYNYYIGLLQGVGVDNGGLYIYDKISSGITYYNYFNVTNGIYPFVSLTYYDDAFYGSNTGGGFYPYPPGSYGNIFKYQIGLPLSGSTLSLPLSLPITYSFSATSNIADYKYILIPTQLGTSFSFSVPMEVPYTIFVNGSNFNVFRTTSTYSTSINIIIS
jgi:uncharacterized repeat protein (TIGR03803 family)